MHCEVNIMRNEYVFSDGIKNPYTTGIKKQKRQITINIDSSTIDYFKKEALNIGIPYQTLINLYLSDCAENRKKLQMTWI